MNGNGGAPSWSEPSREPGAHHRAAASGAARTRLPPAAQGLRHALPHLRAEQPLPLRRRPALHPAGRAAVHVPGAARPARRGAGGDRQRDAARPRQPRGHGRHRRERGTLQGRRQRRRDFLRPRPRRSRRRRDRGVPLHLPAAPRATARHGRLRPDRRPRRAPRLARRPLPSGDLLPDFRPRLEALPSPLRHRPHGRGRCGRRARSAALPGPARPPPRRREMLGQGHLPRAHLPGRPALPRRRARSGGPWSRRRRSGCCGERTGRTPTSP